MTQSAKHFEQQPDKAQEVEETPELAKQPVAEEEPAPPTSEAVEEFQTIERCMNRLLDGIRRRNDDALEELLAEEDHLVYEERKALSDFYMAAAARHIETNQFISGLERNRLLNQSLRHLQPILSVGLRPGLTKERQAYGALAQRVDGVRAAIKQAILSELTPNAEARPKKVEEKTPTPEEPKKKAPTEKAPTEKVSTEKDKVAELAAVELEKAEDGKKKPS